MDEIKVSMSLEEDTETNSNVCGNCKHFRLHYIKRARGSYFPLAYGHCVKPRQKKRHANEKACSYWQEIENI